jgi:hypothetical protein
MVDLGLTEDPFDGLGYLIGVRHGQEGKRTVLGLVDQVGMGQEQLAERLATFGGSEPVEGRGGSTVAPIHVDGQLQSDGGGPETVGERARSCRRRASVLALGDQTTPLVSFEVEGGFTSIVIPVGGSNVNQWLNRVGSSLPDGRDPRNRRALKIPLGDDE